MYGKKFKNADHIDCKIVAFKVKKRVFLHVAKLGLAPLVFFFSLLKVEVFDIIIVK
jgi:hypothetical protein